MKTMTRYNHTVNLSDVEVGDNIDPSIVTRSYDMLGEKLWSSVFDSDENRHYQIAGITKIEHNKDVHIAILIDGETDYFAIASRWDNSHDKLESDWTIKEIGKKIIVDNITKIEKPEEYKDEIKKEYIQNWIDFTFNGLQTGMKYNDEMKMISLNCLKIHIHRKNIRTYVNIHLE